MILPVRAEDAYEAAGDILTSDLGLCMGTGGIPGSLILLTGPMGIGKTEWAKGMARGLGIGGRVASPTFLYLQHHEAPAGQPVSGFLHADWDRVGQGAEDLEESLLEGMEDRVTLVEWGEKLPRSVTDSFLIRIHVSLTWKGEGRHIGMLWSSSGEFESPLLKWRTTFDSCIRRLGVHPDRDRQRSVPVP